MTPGLTFYYDFGSPYSWLVAERIAHALPHVVWQPVEQALVDDRPLWDNNRALIEELAAELNLLPPRWPRDTGELDRVIDGDEIEGVGTHTDPSTHVAMLTATFAKSIGRAIAFSQATFRQIYNAGRQVDDLDTLLLGAAACEMHPRAIIKAIETKSTITNLEQACADAREAGVTALPALGSPDGVTTGVELLDLAITDFVELRPAD
ncbi:MAG TPA: hypothetical protein VGO97_01260 [Solirubrobacterales bacterium]|jgi:2-hydroxychromene-2-carboxylate isomerase|nr:hypothetical protein [Solirubrobacterales bacterium]